MSDRFNFDVTSKELRLLKRFARARGGTISKDVLTSEYDEDTFYHLLDYGYVEGDEAGDIDMPYGDIVLMRAASETYSITIDGVKYLEFRRDEFMRSLAREIITDAISFVTGGILGFLLERLFSIWPV